MVASAASPSTARPVSPAPAPVPASTPIVAHPQASSAGHLPSPLLSSFSSLPPPCSSARCCSLRGCASPVHSLCSAGYCGSHCDSRRCSHHRPSVRPATPSQRLQPLCPPTLPGMPCVRLSFSPHQTTVWWASALPTAPVGGAVADTLHLQCSSTADAPGVWSLFHEAVQLVFCNLQLALHQPALCVPRSPVSVGKRLGGGSPMNDGAVIPSCFFLSVGLGQFNCRRLWG